MIARALFVIALGLAACDPGPTPELRARSASDPSRAPPRFNNDAQGNTTQPQAPPDMPGGGRGGDHKIEKH